MIKNHYRWLSLIAGAMVLLFPVTRTAVAEDEVQALVVKGEARVSIAFPDVCKDAFRKGPVSADQLRKYGLNVRVDSDEEIELVVFVYAVKNGRVGKPWTSYPLRGVSGGGTVMAYKFLPPNEYLPAETFGLEERIRPRKAFQSGDIFLSPDSVRGFLRDSGMPREWTGIMIAVSSTDRKTASGTQTNPLFALVQPTLE